MIDRIKNFLFTKHILVGKECGINQVETLYALLNKLNIMIVKGHEYACPDMIEYAAAQLGTLIPEPFYRGFPRSVRELTSDQLLIDQLIHYVNTYGFGNFEEAGHSLMEDAVARSTFKETEPPHEFIILSEDEAARKFVEFCDSMAEGSRPLNDDMLVLLLSAHDTYSWFPSVCSKSTACELLVSANDRRFATFLEVPDFIRLVDVLNWRKYFHSEHINKLNLKNQDRKLLTTVLNDLIASRDVNISTCCEKRNAWKGILHHIHYYPTTEKARQFVSAIYNKEVRSDYSSFEYNMKNKEYVRAAKILKLCKGNGALLRNLNYIVAKATPEETQEILSLIDAKSPIILLQMLYMYANYDKERRIFKFTRHGKLYTHCESSKRDLAFEDWKVTLICNFIKEKLAKCLKGKIGKVYISPEMYKIGVPLNLSASSSGFGVLPCGSRIKLPEAKKIRAFTYWEKVNDIDLSCFGITNDKRRIEFSWRYMYRNQNEAITFSGDETSGYYGGSEYFDIDIDKVKELYPDIKYFVLCNNVYSGINFNKCMCKAGWMSRDIIDSGEVYEPKTVKSSFVIDRDSYFAYLFAIDINNREVIWLNIADSRKATIAGLTGFDWIEKCFNMTDIMNIGKLFSYMGKVVDNPEEADIVVGDVEVSDKEQIHSWEFEKVSNYLK